LTDFAQRYRGMPDYRLAELAADPSVLIPEAREALEAEIARRPPSAKRRPTQVEERIPAKDPLNGVSGWLAWFGLGLFGGAYNEIRVALSLHGGVASIMLTFSIFCFGMAAWNVATGICMLLRTSFIFRMILIHLIAGGVQGVFIAVDGIALLVYSPRSAEVAWALIGGGLSVCLGYAIWFRYFQVSKRVKTTFGRNL